MKVSPITNYSVCRNNNYNSKQNAKQSNPSFGQIEDLGKRVLKASSKELKDMVEMYHTLPEVAYLDLLKIRNFWGFVKKNESMEAIGKFERELGRLKGEIGVLKTIDTPEASKRLKELEEKGNLGRDEYYNYPWLSSESQVDRDVRETWLREV